MLQQTAPFHHHHNNNFGTWQLHRGKKLIENDNIFCVGQEIDRAKTDKAMANISVNIYYSKEYAEETPDIRGQVR